MKKKIDLEKLIGMIILVALIVTAGTVLTNWLGKREGADRKTTWILVTAAIGAFFLFDTLMVVIHELGHLVMGLLTGYKFVSFRVGSHALVKQDGKLVLRRYEFDGGGGQCLMTHDVVEKDEDIPFFWYHIGGVLFNLILAALYCLVFLNTSNKYVSGAFKLGALMSLLYALINLFPLGIIGVSNDGNNILLQCISPRFRRLILNVLIISGGQCQGETLDEMPDVLFDNADPMGGGFDISIVLSSAARDCERRDFESAKARYTAVLSNKSIIERYRNEASCELLFCDIITEGESAENVDERYEGLKKYIELTGKTQITRHRLMFAYYYIYKHDKENADKEYSLAAEMSENYYWSGEAKAEMALIEYIKENY